MILAALRIEGAKEPELVFLDRPAQIESTVKFRTTVRRGAGEWKILGLSDESLRISVEKAVAVKLVAAAFGDDVEDAAGRLAVFRSVRAGLDLHFLNELEWKVRARSTEGRV